MRYTLREIGTLPPGGPPAPLARRTRVITGTNAAAIVSGSCSSSRSTTVTCVACVTSASAASHTSIST
ncbi:MAG: hypothetical protein U0441_35500 [Polyangiaceae bacterium]